MIDLSKLPGIAAALAVIVLTSAASVPAQQEEPARERPAAEAAPQSPAGGTRLGVIVGRSPQGGPVVLNVARGSAADRAGVRVGDFIQQVGDQQVNTPDELRDAVEKAAGGEPATITVWRNGESHELEASFEQPGGTGDGTEPGSRPWIGIALSDTQQDGAEVVRVYAEGPAAKAGIRVGDRIVGVGEEPVSSANELVQRLRKTTPGQEVELKVVREDGEQMVTVAVGNLENFHERLFGQQFRRRFDDFHRFHDPDLDGIPEYLPRMQGNQGTRGDTRRILEEMSRELRQLRERIDQLEGRGGEGRSREGRGGEAAPEGRPKKELKPDA